MSHRRLGLFNKPSGGGGGVPILESFNYSSSLTANITVNKPSSVASGDLLLMIHMTETTTDGGFLPSSYTGWTLTTKFGSTSSDCWGQCYWRVADGTESASQTVTLTSNSRHVIWYLRISGSNNISPIHIEGNAIATAAFSSVTITSLTTTNNNCLIISMASFDGGDGVIPFTLGGTGWPTSYSDSNQELVVSVGQGYGLRGGWVTKDLSSSGSSSDSTFTNTISDGWSGIQIAITP